jgi:DNA-binding NarL/FixJ family response regulator
MAMTGWIGSAAEVRIVLVALAGLLHDVIRGVLEAQRDMKVVGDVPDCAALQTVLNRDDADLVLWSVDGVDMPDICPRLFDEHPRIKVLTVRDDGRHGSLWECRPCSTQLGEISPRLLVETIRKVVRR